MRRYAHLLLWFAVFAAAAPNGARAAERILTLGAYTAPREAYAEIIPLFVEDWKRRAGDDVAIKESYSGSGAQARAIVDGFEADVAALALETDMTRIADAGLITHDWRATRAGIASSSIVVFGVRAGNPKAIHDWADLARPGLRIVMANPKTSGAAQYTILALYEAARRGAVAGYSGEDGAQRLLAVVLKSVWVMEKGAREAIITFEKGIGDAVITYENETRLAAPQGVEVVIPRATLRTDHPIAVIDRYAEKHGQAELARAFVAFHGTPAAQAVFAKHGFRPADPAAAEAAGYPAVADLFTIEALGGWPRAAKQFFAPDGIYSRAAERMMRAR